MAPDNTPFISITDDGNITGAKICSAENNSYFVAQFGGESGRLDNHGRLHNNTSPLFAHIYFTSVNLQRQPGKSVLPNIWDSIESNCNVLEQILAETPEKKT